MIIKAQQWHELVAVACVPTGYCDNCASYAKRSKYRKAEKQEIRILAEKEFLKLLT